MNIPNGGNTYDKVEDVYITSTWDMTRIATI